MFNLRTSFSSRVDRFMPKLSAGVLERSERELSARRAIPSKAPLFVAVILKTALFEAVTLAPAVAVERKPRRSAFALPAPASDTLRSEEHTSELQSRLH